MSFKSGVKDRLEWSVLTCCSSGRLRESTPSRWRARSVWWNNARSWWSRDWRVETPRPRHRWYCNITTSSSDQLVDQSINKSSKQSIDWSSANSKTDSEATQHKFFTG